MATPRKPRNAESEFVSREDAERMAQDAAGRAMMQYPDAEPPESTEDDPDDIALANVIADLGGPGIDAKVNVYQLDKNKNKAFVGAFLPTEFSLEAIQTNFGPGDYEVHVRKDGRLATRKVLRIAHPVSNSMPAVLPQMGQPQNDKIIEAMQNGFKEITTMFSNALGQLASNQPKPKTTMEMLQEMSMMREIMGVNNQPQIDSMKVLETAMTLAEKITPRTGEPGAGEIIMETLKNLGPVFNKVLENQNQSRPQISPMILPTPQPVNSLAVPANIPQQNESDEMNVMKRYYLNMLIAQAQNDNDTLTYANMLLDVVGEEKALEFINSPNWFENLKAEDARVANHQAWFERMRADVLELTKPEESAIDEESTQPPKP